MSEEFDKAKLAKDLYNVIANAMTELEKIEGPIDCSAFGLKTGAQSHSIDWYPEDNAWRAVAWPEYSETIHAKMARARLAVDSPEIYKSARTIGREIEKHYVEHPEHGYNCTDMDTHIREWRTTIQNAKPTGITAVRAFRRVMVEGERDW